MLKVTCLAIVFMICGFLYGQDSTFYKSAYAGGYLVVSNNESWELDRVFINGGDAYSILISNANFKKSIYHQQDTIRTPFYVAEMELLETQDMVQYQFYFKRIKAN